MAPQKTPSKPPLTAGPEPVTRQQREAAALRDNLAKRKAQMRQRQADEPPENQG